MPDLSVSESQLEALESIRAELESAYVGEYGTMRMTDTVQYLLDTYTPPDAAEGQRSPADIEGLTALDGVGEATAEALAIAGFRTVEDVASSNPRSLTELKGIGEEQAVDIVAAATEAIATTETERVAEKEMKNETADEASGSKTTEPRDGDSPESTLQQAMNLLDAHDDRWREADGDEPYEVDLPDGSTEAVRTKDDIKRLIFKHWR